MTVLAETRDSVGLRPAPTSKGWKLTTAAESQMVALGVDAAEVIDVIRRPEQRQQSVHPGRERWIGQGLVLVVENMMVLNVYLDGANNSTWEDAARKRAERRAKQLVREQASSTGGVVYSTSTGDDEAVEEYADTSFVYAVPRMPKGEGKNNPVMCRNLLDGVHPALRPKVLEQLEGDFSRLKIHSHVRVEILPPKPRQG